jgi:hypothetical protein
MTEVFEEESDLGRGDARKGERGKMAFSEELGVGGFVAGLRRATNDVRKEEEFVGVEEVGRMTVKVAVEESGKSGDVDLIAGFFASFADGRGGRRLADISPAAGEGPATVFEFANQQDAAIVKSGDTNIDFRSGITGLLAEQIGNGSGIGKRVAGSCYFRGDIANFVITMNIKFVFAVGETTLRDGLKTARPSEPWRNGHGGILAASEAVNKSKG